MNIDLAGLEPAPLENWYRHNYFNNEIDISGSGVEDYTFKQVKDIAGFDFDEIDELEIKDAQTIGSQNIRQKIATLFGKENPEMVMVTNGANEGLHLIVRSILKEGDEIVTLGPCYHCHDKIAKSIGCRIKKWNLEEKRNFELDIADLRNLITKDTKAILLNFPHNPTGKSITQNMLDEIVNLCRDTSIYLVWDAVFQSLVYNNRPLEDPIHRYEKVITLGTFSKAYGAPGLRFGWIIGEEKIIESCVRQKDYGNLYVAPIIEFIAEKMLSNIEKFSRPRLIQAANNREIVNNWINRKDLNIQWNLPDGGVCGLVKLPDNYNDIQFCTEVLENEQVLLVPGSCFEFPGYARLGFGGCTKKLTAGLSSLEKYLI